MIKNQGKQRLLFGFAGLFPVLILVVLSLAGCAGSEPMKTQPQGEPQPQVTSSENQPSLISKFFRLMGWTDSEPMKTSPEGEPQPQITLSENMPSADTTQLQKPPILATGLSPLNPQPADTALVPGLAVSYFFNYKARHLNPLTNGNVPNKRGTPGKPIPYLNHQFGRGEVFDSGRTRLVAMRMQGLLYFSQSGTYTLLGLANDGLRIYLNDQRIIDDPAWHARGDQYTVGVIAEIAQAGWYPMKVEYNQRKGTAAIGFFWRRPGADGFEPVPAEAYAHIPGSGQ